MPDEDILTVTRDSRILYGEGFVDFPFQKNIHQLPKEEFIECLYDLYFREDAAEEVAPDSFQGMLYEKFGRAISEKFLVPYNEKLYACDLEELDREAMGRFFPHADLRRYYPQHAPRRQQLVQRHVHLPARAGPSSTCEALALGMSPTTIALSEALAEIDLVERGWPPPRLAARSSSTT